MSDTPRVPHTIKVMRLCDEGLGSIPQEAVIETLAYIDAIESELAAANMELQKRDQCSFIGPMRDCPTHGESQRLKDAERSAEENARNAERYRWLREDWSNRKWRHVPIGSGQEADDITTIEEIDAAIDAARNEEGET